MLDKAKPRALESIDTFVDTTRIAKETKQSKIEIYNNFRPLSRTFANGRKKDDRLFPYTIG